MNEWLWLSLGALFVAGATLVMAIAPALAVRAPAPARADAMALPLAWRLAWPVAARLAPAIGARLGAARRARLRALLSHAGLDRTVSPEQLAATQCAMALAVAGVSVLVVQASGAVPWFATLPAALLGGLWPGLQAQARARQRRHAVLRQLPHDLDLVTLAVEAGLNLGAALGQAARHGPPGPLRDEWQRVLRDVHAGQPRHEALRAMAARLDQPAVSNVVAALLAAERQGASVAPILRAQAEQRRTERFLRAERLAMEAPVKMLFPLVVCIFPGTFAILLFPVLHQLVREGVL